MSNLVAVELWTFMPFTASVVAPAVVLMVPFTIVQALSAEDFVRASDWSPAKV